MSSHAQVGVSASEPQWAEFAYEKFGYPALTPAIKRKIFGLNAMRVYGLDATVVRRRLSKDRVKKVRDEYLNDPQPSFATYGPRTRREFLALRELLAALP